MIVDVALLYFNIWITEELEIWDDVYVHVNEFTRLV